MTRAINAYRSITATDELKEIERLGEEREGTAKRSVSIVGLRLLRRGGGGRSRWR